MDYSRNLAFQTTEPCSYRRVPVAVWTSIGAALVTAAACAGGNDVANVTGERPEAGSASYSTSSGSTVTGSTGRAMGTHSATTGGGAGDHSVSASTGGGISTSTIGTTGNSESSSGPSGGSSISTGGSRPDAGATITTTGGTGGQSTATRDAGATGGDGGARASTTGRDGGVGTTGGTSGTGGASGTGGTASCPSGPVTLNQNPFGCKFAWGASPSGSLGAYGYLQFATYWIESQIHSDGSFGTCSGCSWVKNNFGSTNAIPVYYAYIIGFLGHANGLTDGNTCPSNQPNCPNLTNQGAAMIRSNRSKIVQAYANYAQQTHAVWPTKPLLWLLEGDFVQYAGTSQANPLTMTELARLGADITCAIKANMPNAVVALNHSTWNPDQVTKDYWNAMNTAGVPYDMVWTTGVANNNGYFSPGVGPSSYNGSTATYGYVHQLTGKTIWVDDSCGVSAMADTWSTSSAATLNMRIASGVIAFAHCGAPPSSYQSATGALEPQLASTCQ